MRRLFKELSNATNSETKMVIMAPVLEVISDNISLWVHNGMIIVWNDLQIRCLVREVRWK